MKHISNKFILSFYILACLFIAPIQATSTESVVETLKLSPSDPIAGSEFGSDVAISGDTIVVGAAGTEFQHGAAYIFRRNHGGGNQWGEVVKLIPSDSMPADRFGWSVAISGDIAVVSSLYSDDGTDRIGAAYVFERNYGGLNHWGEVLKITASHGDVTDNFGYSVSISGNTIAIGAPLHESNGAVYVYERSYGGTNNWGEVTKLTSSTTTIDDRFGFHTAIDNDIIAIGAPGYNHVGTNSGAAFVFKRSPINLYDWHEEARLTASDSASHDHFGLISVSGERILVGANGDDHSGYENAGSAYIFERNDEGPALWMETAKLTSWKISHTTGLGFAAAIEGETVLLGSVGSTLSSPTLAFQQEQAGNWTGVTELIASDVEAFDVFGMSIAINGGTAVVASKRDDDSGLNSGSAYVFEGFVASNQTDETPPELVVSDNLFVEATSEAGAIVSYQAATATDNVGVTEGPICTPESSSLFSLGETTVLCTATDSAGNTGSATFNITVQDTTPPDTIITSVIDSEGNSLNHNASTLSTSVTFTFDGIDLVGPVTFQCSLNGTAFYACDRITNLTLPIGTYNLQVRAIDAANNIDPTPSSFSWQITSEAEALAELVELIISYNLPKGVTNSLVAPLNTAIKRLSDENPNNDTAACNTIDAFISRVNAQAGTKLSLTQANQMSSQAEAIYTSLNCSN